MLDKNYKQHNLRFYSILASVKQRDEPSACIQQLVKDTVEVQHNMSVTTLCSAISSFQYFYSPKTPNWGQC